MVSFVDCLVCVFVVIVVFWVSVCVGIYTIGYARMCHSGCMSLSVCVSEGVWVCEYV